MAQLSCHRTHHRTQHKRILCHHTHHNLTNYFPYIITQHHLSHHIQYSAPQTLQHPSQLSITYLTISSIVHHPLQHPSQLSITSLTISSTVHHPLLHASQLSITYLTTSSIVHHPLQHPYSSASLASLYPAAQTLLAPCP